MISRKCIELVKEFEGFSPVPYLCPAGYWTIGYGEVLGREWKDEWKDLRLTREAAEIRLRHKLIQYSLAILPLIKVPYHQYMLDALTSFSYNVGIFAFRSSTLRSKLNRREYYDAGEEFLKWVYAGGKKLKGLERRRIKERELFLEGVRLLENMYYAF